MRWPWSRRTEQRAYTDSYVTALVRAAAGGGADPAATAAVQAAAGHWSRSLGAAEVTPIGGSTDAITPSVLFQVGRDLVLDGQSTWLLRIGPSGPMLLRPCEVEVAGGLDPETWTYRLTLQGPSRKQVVIGARTEVVHIIVNADADKPHVGVSPIVAAGSTSAMLAGLEKNLQLEVSAATGYVIPSASSEGLDSTAFEALKADLGAMAGASRIVPSMGPRSGDPSSRPADADWKPQRVGANVPVTIVELRSQAALSVLAACGIPLPMVSPEADSAALREALRQFVGTVVAPTARLVQREFSRVLEMDVKLDFTQLQAGDIQGRGRALKAMTDAGIPLAEAQRLTDLT